MMGCSYPNCALRVPSCAYPHCVLRLQTSGRPRRLPSIFWPILVRPTVARALPRIVLAFGVTQVKFVRDERPSIAVMTASRPPKESRPSSSENFATGRLCDVSLSRRMQKSMQSSADGGAVGSAQAIAAALRAKLRQSFVTRGSQLEVMLLAVNKVRKAIGRVATVDMLRRLCSTEAIALARDFKSFAYDSRFVAKERVVDVYRALRELEWRDASLSSFAHILLDDDRIDHQNSRRRDQ